MKKLQEKNKNIFLPRKYIFYSGSYLYRPNKQAIDLLNKFFMPKLVKKFPDLKLILTGGGYYNNHKWLIDLGIISKNYLVKVLKHSQLILAPIYEGYGTRVKIIEALMLGVPVVSSSKGIEGIDYKSGVFKNPLVHQNKNILLKYAIKVLKNNKLYKKNSKENKFKYLALFDAYNKLSFMILVIVIVNLCIFI
jgi:glycosyltransferase involved in cell wall biosynthesis